jgi:hypothetical protein
MILSLKAQLGHYPQFGCIDLSGKLHEHGKNHKLKHCFDSHPDHAQHSLPIQMHRFVDR